jgi:adenylate kinase family enzyme
VSYFAVVRGPLGAGKTTVARALASEIGAVYVEIDSLLERYEWDGGSEALFLRTNEDAARAARPSLDRGRPAVFDGNFYWRSAVDDLGRRLPFPHVVYALRVPLDLCIARDRARELAYGEEATRAVFAKVGPIPGEVPVDGTRELARIVEEIRADLGRRGWVARRAR